LTESERVENLYLHIPFCTWVCKYCDFNAYAVLEGMIPPYVEALMAEILAASGRYPIGPLKTLFIGGGTPSLLGVGQLDDIMATARQAIGLGTGAEVTLEANPGTITPQKLEGWLRAGVTRLSVGVQSLRPDALRFLERLHSGEEALAAVRLAKAAGFNDVNCDLLYGVPGQSTAQWAEVLEGVLAEGPTHVSCYELTVEAGTRLNQEVHRGLTRIPDADTQLEQYWLADRRLRAAGFTHYEISNWALPGHECRHNVAGWDYRPYIGCGAGAHSMLRHGDGRTERFWNRKGPRAYIDTVKSTGEAIDGREWLSPLQAAGEAAMIGVRKLAGTSAAQPFTDQRSLLAAAGLLVQEEDLVHLTPRGIELANQVSAAFLC
jgi:oxygen-independent coproporphyrinogen-3 oxidase